MFKRVLCWLLLPLCTIGVLAGCGKNKSAEMISNLYSDIKAEYKDKNHIFKETSDKVVTNQLFITYDGEMGKIYTSALNKDDFKADLNLYYRYVVLVEYQQAILTRISEYYDKWEEGFYSGLKLKDVDKDELNALYKTLEQFRQDLRDFEVARKKVESDINIMTFTGAIRSNLTEYSYQFNMLIEKYANFVNQVRDLQVKYLFDNNSIPETNNRDALNRLVDEFYLNYSQALYYRALKSFNRTNECDLADFAFKLYGTNGDYFAITKAYPYNFNGFTADTVVGKDAEIEEFLYVRNSFIQKFAIYKKIYDSVNYYEYNQNVVEDILKNTNENTDKYIDKLSDVDKANIRLIESFEETLLQSYKSAFLDLIK